MSEPGWYPNPEGRGEPRYWDGSAWRDEEPRRQSPVSWIVAGVTLIAVIVAVLVLQPRGLGFTGAPGQVDTRSSRPSVSPWDERSREPTESGTPDDGGGRPALCEDVGSPVSDVAPDGRLHGGGVSVVAPTGPGWSAAPTYMPWMSEQNSRSIEIVPGWVGSVDVGTVRNQDGFVNPKQAARAMISCMASSWMYSGYVDDEELTSETFTLDGRSGWHVKVNVHVDRDDGIEGDVLDIFVLDIGRDGELSVVVGCATINHEQSIRDVDAALATMQVD
ncbi:hypothetical protein [uncultured Tessaracoccus sp.]|uniref:hypothetical protein n=1 Tax=uncultured Tessaracoccus sp. TaxID=905023 RepID=UPI0025FE6E31|nr:hypothetical protein [uncultured Tessaracoccus sp.]